MSVSPLTASVLLGATQQFSATVSNSTNPAVNWSLSGAGCGGAACGTIDATGLYTAPAILPSPSTVTLTATSVADPAKSSSAVVTIVSNFTLSVSGPTSLNAGASATYTATLTPATNSHPSTTVNWSVTGPGCTGAACGIIASTGPDAATYAAPATPPSPNSVVITAIPAADPAKTASLSVAVNSQISVAISPTSASVPAGTTQVFTATVSGAQDISVTWDVNGIVGGNAAVGTVAQSPGDPTQATYTAPAAIPTSNQIIVRARSNADANAYAAATVAIISPIAIQLTPTGATLAVSHRQTFFAQVTGSANQSVTWQVNGLPGGNTTIGQICAPGSNPCQQVTVTNGASVDYLAPASVPSPNPVTLTAVSQADSTSSGTAPVTILAAIVVSVSPPSVTLAAGATQQFTATVLGTSNQRVTWTISGPACGGTGSPCGTIDPTGLYTAPISTPSSNTLLVVATSSGDPSRSGTSSVTLSTAPTITALLPASATAGAAGGFTLRVEGGNFMPSSPGPGSTIRFNGTARTTTCLTSGDCTTTLSSSDLALAGSLPVQLQNPDSTLSNQVAFVVVPDATSVDVILLTPGAPSAVGKDIVVVEPSTAGASAPQANVTLDVVALGLFSPSTNTCTLGGGPVVLLRPGSGTVTADICAFSVSGLDASFGYSFTGPSPNDIAIVGAEPLGLGIIHLTVQIPSTAQIGPRTLFITNANKDKTAASGAVVVK